MGIAVLNEKQLADLMGYVCIGDVERKLIEQGIKPIYGKPGHFFVTQDMLCKLHDETPMNHSDYEELI